MKRTTLEFIFKGVHGFRDRLPPRSSGGATVGDNSQQSNISQIFPQKFFPRFFLRMSDILLTFAVTTITKQLTT